MFTNERVKVCFGRRRGERREILGRVQVFCINIHAALTKLNIPKEMGLLFIYDAILTYSITIENILLNVSTSFTNTFSISCTSHFILYDNWLIH